MTPPVVKESHGLLSGRAQVDAELDERLIRDALPLADEAKQELLGPDVAGSSSRASSWASATICFAWSVNLSNVAYISSELLI